MALTKKDFAQLAVIIGEHEARLYKQLAPNQLIDRGLFNDIARFCHAQNPNFNISTFTIAVDEARNASL